MASEIGLDGIDLSVMLVKNHTPTYLKQIRHDLESVPRTWQRVKNSRIKQWAHYAHRPNLVCGCSSSDCREIGYR